jgi:glycosyltransferase involved in cell wall biosynthesis
MARVLHVLSQRPSRTGSGITVDALVRHAAAAGHEQRVVVGTPVEDPRPEVGGLSPEKVLPLTFGDGGDLDFPVPGMSDVMPYRSTRFSSMSEGQLRAYRDAWRVHLARVMDDFRPELIHSHHLWIVSSMLKQIAPRTPVVTQCHATGFRQMELCPHVAGEVRAGCARNDRFVVLHRQHAEQLARTLGVASSRVHVVGAGYRDELFHARGRRPVDPPRLVYIGKYSAAKGLPWLLDAFERLRAERPGIELHVAGSGAGEEADRLLARMRTLASGVVLHGMLAQPELAALLRSCVVCVLPSFYEGLPLVLVEALACGCRIVATDLPGVREQLAPAMGPLLHRIALPRLAGVDVPEPDDLPAFVERLHAAMATALDAGEIDLRPVALAPFTWSAVYRRIESVWREPGREREPGS